MRIPQHSLDYDARLREMSGCLMNGSRAYISSPVDHVNPSTQWGQPVRTRINPPLRLQRHLDRNHPPDMQAQCPGAEFRDGQPHVATGSHEHSAQANGGDGRRGAHQRRLLCYEQHRVERIPLVSRVCGGMHSESFRSQPMREARTPNLTLKSQYHRFCLGQFCRFVYVILFCITSGSVRDLRSSVGYRTYCQA